MSKCWSCGSVNYSESTYSEHCPDCGIFCNYISGNHNDEYEEGMRRKRDEEEERNEQYRRSLYGEDN